MSIDKIKLWLLAVGGAVIALFLFIFGLRLLFTPNSASDGQLFLLGIGCILSGVFILASQVYIPNKISMSLALMVLGLYFFARAQGIIDGALFIRFLGLASLIGAGLIVGVTYFASQKIKF